MKTRGRPKGSKNKNKVQKVKKAVVVNSSPKKRGRPRKNPEALVVVNKPAVIEGEKRGRGRPRKNPEAVVSVIKPVASAVQNSEAPKKRGRPKKIDQIAEARTELLTREATISENLSIKRGRPTKEAAGTKNELDEKFEKEKAQFLAAHKDDSSSYVHIPTIAEIEYQKKQQVKTTEHELIITEEIQRQKDKAFRFKMSATGISKPNLNKHEDAFYINHTPSGREITFLLDVGDKILVEYPQNWRRTELWVIDEVSENGNVRLKNFENSYYGAINFITGPTVYGLKIKKELTTKKGK